jgi:hypothetical protein
MKFGMWQLWQLLQLAQNSHLLEVVSANEPGLHADYQ